MVKLSLICLAIIRFYLAKFSLFQEDYFLLIFFLKKKGLGHNSNIQPFRGMHLYIKKNPEQILPKLKRERLGGCELGCLDQARTQSTHWARGWGSSGWPAAASAPTTASSTPSTPSSAQTSAHSPNGSPPTSSTSAEPWALSPWTSSTTPFTMSSFWASPYPSSTHGSPIGSSARAFSILFQGFVFSLLIKIIFIEQFPWISWINMCFIVTILRYL